ncbi:aminotransferase class III-fold pyridoxal phosphate-dependent enzyme [Dactylosporangium sp. CA-233914]|uniref:aminotransferase class III-fold pyridoxal phosphate-dependent enzyme n=1 Tax=Dactylosporangium sp. CA-233914 TaxID=3239934 RepID=UPI003D8DDDC3
MATDIDALEAALDFDGDFVPEHDLDVLRRGRDLHLDHYGGGRLPFAAIGATGLVHQFVELDGPDRGRVLDVLDASGGYASACLGAASEVSERALVRAVRTGGHATDELASLERSRLLVTLFGPDGLWAGHFPAGEYHVSGRNSGSEGMELALRLVLEARVDHRRLRPSARLGGRDRILAFEGAWHGWTGGLVPLLNRRHYRFGLPGPEPEGAYGLRIDHISFGDADAVSTYLAAHGEQLAAVIVEPVQGDAGIQVPPRGYLRGLARAVRRAGALLVADEVLTFAKTGGFFAMADDEGPIPTDITVIGKSLGMGALSTAMVIARRELALRPTGAVSTSDLRPLTCAVIGDGLRHIVAEGLLEQSRATGRALHDLLRRELVEAFPGLYREARGIGLLQGVELTEAAAARLPQLRSALIRSGVYVEFMAGAGRRSNGERYVHPTLRVAPPLTAGPKDAERIVERIAAGSARTGAAR